MAHIYALTSSAPAACFHKALGLCAGAALLAAGLMSATPAQSQERLFRDSRNPAHSSRQTLEQPYGGTLSEREKPFRPETRDANGNRVITSYRTNDGNGRASALSSSFGFAGGVGNTSQAIGNNLSVTVQGSWNTVIVDSVQINEGDQRAELEIDEER